MISLSKPKYWPRLVDYYYDHIHWEEGNQLSLYTWLKRDYNADTSLRSTVISFANDQDANWFLLRWE